MTKPSTTKNHITDEAAKRLAVEPLDDDHPEVTGAGPVTTVDEGGDAPAVVEDKARRPGVDDVDEGEPVGRSNNGEAP